MQGLYFVIILVACTLMGQYSANSRRTSFPLLSVYLMGAKDNIMKFLNFMLAFFYSYPSLHPT